MGRIHRLSKCPISFQACRAVNIVDFLRQPPAEKRSYERKKKEKEEGKNRKTNETRGAENEMEKKGKTKQEEDEKKNLHLVSAGGSNGPSK